MFTHFHTGISILIMNSVEGDYVRFIYRERLGVINDRL